MYIQKISSLKNDRVKTWKHFSKNSYRKKSTHFFVEGLKEVKRGLHSEFAISELIYCGSILNEDEKANLLSFIPDTCQIFEVDQAVYTHLAYRGETEGVIGIFRKKEKHLDDISLKADENNLILVLENLEKPGNLGAILRTADAVAARAVILTGNAMDIYNPNAIRSSLGAFFSVPIYQTENNVVKKWLEDCSIDHLCAALPAFKSFYSISLKKDMAFVFGSEHSGLSDFWIADTDHVFTLPMHGIMDSLNLSVSVAVTSYEYLRQFPLGE